MLIPDWESGSLFPVQIVGRSVNGVTHGVIGSGTRGLRSVGWLLILTFRSMPDEVIPVEDVGEVRFGHEFTVTVNEHSVGAAAVP